MAVNVYIKMYPYLLQYMSKEVARRDGTMGLSQKSLFGMAVLNLLDKNPQDASLAEPEESHLTLVLCNRHAEEFGTYLSDEKALMVQKWIKRSYEEEFLRFIRVQRIMYGCRTAKAIHAWRERYGITESIRTFDADLKEFNRKR